MSLHTHVYKRDRKITLRYYPYEKPVFITLTTEQTRGGLRTQGPQLTSSQWCRFMQLPWEQSCSDGKLIQIAWLHVCFTYVLSKYQLAFLLLELSGSRLSPKTCNPFVPSWEKWEYQGHWFNTSKGFQDGTSRSGNSPGPSEWYHSQPHHEITSGWAFWNLFSGLSAGTESP